MEEDRTLTLPQEPKAWLTRAEFQCLLDTLYYDRGISYEDIGELVPVFKIAPFKRWYDEWGDRSGQITECQK